jgi:Sec-independent protein translocase protein TatA
VVAAVRLVSLLLLGLLLFLLFGGSRLSAAGKGLGQAVRHVKRAVGNDADPVAEPVPPIMTVSSVSERKEPKLLPAKGESSASAVDGVAAAGAQPPAGDEKT